MWSSLSIVADWQQIQFGIRLHNSNDCMVFVHECQSKAERCTLQIAFRDQLKGEWHCDAQDRLLPNPMSMSQADVLVRIISWHAHSQLRADSSEQVCTALMICLLTAS